MGQAIDEQVNEENYSDISVLVYSILLYKSYIRSYNSVNDYYRESKLEKKKKDYGGVKCLKFLKYRCQTLDYC